MATVDIEIAARTYPVSCRDGEEPHLHALAALVDRKAKEAAAAVGNMGEARQLLFASLLLADELKELRSGGPGAVAAEPEPDPAVANALDRLAERMEMLADRLESKA
jgi:cell division protein ZapA